ncbi:MAG: hypothetical protein JO243_10430, partial [Solirubrobacterales bacterium]|nr:hypothetical protein [Solirubrobacterales bacterium]
MAAVQSRRHFIGQAAKAAMLAVVVGLGATPAGAQAHGPIAPVASSYFAKVLKVPAGIDAKVIDGDLRMWLHVPADQSVVVLDYRGAPYLRFSRGGVAVNHNSAMYYLNQTPFAQTPPANLTARTPPSWHPVSDGDAYEWHDGRLHALATVALAPGVSFVGRWAVPLRVDGRLAAIEGGLWHAEDPSIVWFWPIVVLLGCVLAARRVRRRGLDLLVARTLAVTGLVALAIAGFGLQLHGRPSVSIFQLVELALILAFVAWGLWRVLLRGPGYFAAFLIAVGAVWAGGVLFPTLLDGFVLIAVPAFVARAAAVACLASGAGLLLYV